MENEFIDDILQNVTEITSTVSTTCSSVESLINEASIIADNTHASNADKYIARLEQVFGITTDITKPIQFRRENIMSKIRGSGTTTVAMIKNVAESFTNGSVDVIEDSANYKFTVKFTGTKGIPDNMDGLTAILEDVKPAHLGYSYKYIFNTNSYLHAFTNAQLHSYTNKQIKEDTLNVN